MKTIGLIGGMSWESTRTYYEIINRSVAARLGGLHSARVVLYSVDFDDIEPLQVNGEWETAGRVLAGAARSVQAAGADFLLLCTNTMHRVADAVQASVSIPLLHIADPTGLALRSAGIFRVGLLGTRYTMTQPFYERRLEEDFDLEVMVPPDADQEVVNEIIYRELCRGIVRDLSRQHVLEMVHNLEKRGAQAVILGCTELSLLVGEKDTATPVYDTTRLHAEAAVEAAVAGLPGVDGEPGIAFGQDLGAAVDRRARPRPAEPRDGGVRGADLGE